MKNIFLLFYEYKNEIKLKHSYFLYSMNNYFYITFSNICLILLFILYIHYKFFNQNHYKKNFIIYFADKN